MSITVVGTVALDSIESPFGKRDYCLGGSATHFSASASFFTKVNLVAVIGEDFPAEHIRFLESRHIDLSGLKKQKGGKTFRWEGCYVEGCEDAQTRATHLNVIENYQPELPSSYKSSDILFLGNIDPQQQARLIQLAGRPKLIAMDTMNLWINIKKEAVMATIALTDLVVINETESRMLTNEHLVLKAVKALQNLGPKTIVIKRGSYGALLFHGDQFFSAPAFPVTSVFDPTGAGDSFAGGLLGYLDSCSKISFETLKTATICGSVMASFNIEKFSCDRLKEISMADIQKRFQAFKQLVQFEDIKS